MTGVLGNVLTFITKFKKWIFKNKKYYKVNFVFGSCMFINSKLFKELNGFDKDYFLFTEEADLCYRAWKNTKYKVIYYFDSKIVHIKSLITGKNMPERLRYNYESKLKFFKKHYSVLRILVLKHFILMTFFLRYITLFRKRNKKIRESYRSAYLDIISLYITTKI
jgi:GT2 family glycosyltransferase